MSFAPVKSGPHVLGASTVIDVDGYDARTLIVVNGSESGNITVTAQVIGGTRYNSVTNGSIDLSSKDYIYIPDIPIKSVTITYDGAGAPTATIYQLPNV